MHIYSKILNFIFLFICSIIGVIHLGFVVSGLVVFRENAPWTSLVTIFIGPFLTFPCTIIGIYKPRIAAWCMICGATTSLIILLIIQDLFSKDLYRSFFDINLPMYIIGSGLLWLISTPSSPDSTPRNTKI